MISISLTACSTTQQRIDAAGARIGAAAARIELPPWPAECKRDTPHAEVKIGDELVSLFRRERGQVDLANAQKDRCAAHYENLRTGLAGDGN